MHAEQEVLGALRTLPPDAHVFIRLRILDPETNRDREIDFLVAHPDLGLVIVEVKGKGVECRGGTWTRRDLHGFEEVLDETPGEQILAQQHLLLKHLQGAGPGFIPQVTRMLALPAMPLADDQDLGPDLPACRILTQAKLRHPFLALRAGVSGGTAWEAWRTSPEARLHTIRPDVMRRILEALLPKLAPPPPLAVLLEAEGRLQDMAARNMLDHLAANFAQGRYHVAGGPGSGKSLLGRQVTRIWAAEGRRVLVVAYNKALTYATQCALDDLIQAGQVDVSTFHDLAENALSLADQVPERCEDGPWFDEVLPAAFRSLLESGADLPELRYGALVVDEAQDLEPHWVAPLLHLLERPETDPVLLLEDPAQSLYRAGRHALGQPWRLDLSLRQHPAIRRAACMAFPGCGWEAPEEIPDEQAVFRVDSGPARWREDLEQWLRRLAQEGVRPEDVLVLAPHRPETLGIRDGDPLGPWVVNTEADWWEADKAGRVRMGTVYLFKGLEADVVIYLDPRYRHKDAGPLAYTAFSRARHRLVVLERALAEPVKRKPATEPVAPAPPPAPRPAPPRAAVAFGPEAKASLLASLRGLAEKDAERASLRQTGAGPGRPREDAPLEPQGAPAL